MPSERDLMKQSVEHQTPKSVKKRPAPAPSDPTRIEQEQKEFRYGVPFLARVHPDTKDAVDKAVADHNVQKGSLVDFLLRASLYQLKTGRIELPIIGDDDKPKKLRLPPLE